MKFRDFIKKINEAGLDNWNKESVTKFEKTLGKTVHEEGFFDACVIKMKEGMTDDQAKGACAKIIDIGKGTTDWRTGPSGEHKEK
jgi:hypothetical protein